MSVSIGTRQLAQYTYREDYAKRYSEELAYGNDDVVKYEYDTKGSVIEEKYENSDGTGHTVTYTYHFRGLMAAKHDTATGITTKYVYAANGFPLSVTCNDATYFYITNLQGDVIAIIDQDGCWIAKYEYDAWGNQFWWEVNHDSDFDVNIASINPLRYRGYVYDRHTGLYYLQSRYYNPEWGRFINADSQLNADTPIELNLFAYCSNNPVNFVDHSGHSATAIILSVIAVAGLFATIAGVATDNNTLTAIGLTAVAIPAMISGGMAFGLLTPVGMIVGAVHFLLGQGRGCLPVQSIKKPLPATTG